MVVVFCQECGRPFNVKPSRIDRGRGKYCSIECYNKNRLKVRPPPKETLEDLYWNKNLSLTDISRMFSVSESTVRRWFKLYNISKRPRSEALRMKLCLRPNLNPSPHLSYILGVLLGDGSVFKRKSGNGCYGHYIALTVKDEVFAREFAESLKAIGLDPLMSKNSRGYHQVRATSVEFYKWFKSLTLQKIKEIALKYPAEFVKGFWESEGTIIKDRRRKTYYSLRMSNTKISYLRLVKTALDRLGVKSKLYEKRRSNGCYALEIRGSLEEKIAFLKKIRPCIRGELPFP